MPRDWLLRPVSLTFHTHAENVVANPRAENFVRMGVTMIVTGNCGGPVLNVAEFFKRIEEKTVSVNVATLIGHNTVRSSAMGGSVNRPPTEEELAKMKSLVEQAMKDGAVGISTGLIYLPGAFAKTEEIIELAKVASAYDGIYASHLRGEGTTILNSLNELFRIAREAKIRAEISHIKLSGKSAWGRTDEVIAAIEKARAEGLDITQDQYVYTASSTGISQLIPASAREGGRAKFAERIGNPVAKAKIVAQMKENLQRGGLREGVWADIVIFDPEKIQDVATFNDPHHYATGIVHVFVNGVAVMKDGEHTDAKPGKALRHKG